MGHILKMHPLCKLKLLGPRWQGGAGKHRIITIDQFTHPGPFTHLALATRFGKLPNQWPQTHTLS